MKPQLSEERISLRTNAKTKQYLLAAANLSGYNNLTSFIITIAFKEAQKIINESQTGFLSNRDRDLVLNLLNDPPEPNARLKKMLLMAEKRNHQLIKDTQK